MASRDYYQTGGPKYNPYRDPGQEERSLPPLPHEASQTGPPRYHPYRTPGQEPPSLPPLPHEPSRGDWGSLSPQPFASAFDTPPTYPSSPTAEPLDPKYHGRNNAEAYSLTDGRSSRYSGWSGPSPYGSDRQRQYSDEIPLRENPRIDERSNKTPSPGRSAQSPDELPPPVQAAETDAERDARREARRQRERERRRQSRPPEPPKKFFSRQNTWIVYFFTLVQLTVFIAELVKNSILTGSPIEIHPQINPMLGPSFPVLVNMGARYVPCMKNVPNLVANVQWPCPNMTTNDPNDPSNHCSINQLCGFEDFGNSPNQWYRFITPIFLHAGIIHIAFNLLLQLTLGREIEQIIGSIRFLVVYMASGIFGFVLGGNYAAPGIASTGASGGLFGIIAIQLLDLLYTWHDRVSPKKELAFIVLDVLVSFALGLLPGLDNFSHIGGFLMGLVLGVCILHSPDLLRLEKKRPDTEAADPTKKKRSRRAKRVSYKTFAKDPAAFFKGRQSWWWVWWLVRAGALIGVLIAFIVLLNTFYLNENNCTWCHYLSCIDVYNWCNMGQLPTTDNPNRMMLLAREL